MPRNARRRLIPPFSLLLLCLCSGFLLLACGPSDPVEKAKAILARGPVNDQTIEDLRTLIAEYPDENAIHFLYGKALSTSGKISLSEWSLRRAAKDPEWRVKAASQLANNAARSGNYETTLHFVSEVLEEDPDNVDLLILRAKAAAASRIFSEEALADADRALELEPTNADAMEPRILALLNLERYEEAGEEIERLGEMIDADAEASDAIRGWHCTTTALYASDSGEEALALERFEECLDQFPDNANLITSAVSFFDQRGELARSTEIIETGLEFYPESLDYRRQLAVRLSAAAEPERAEQILIEGTEVADEGYAPLAWQILGKHYQGEEQHELALEAFRTSVELTQEADTPNSQYLFDYADALILGGEYDTASEVAAQMTVPAHRYMTLARIAQETSRHDEALRQFERAFLLWPDNPWARYAAALSAEQIGDFDAAADYYRYAIRIDPGTTDARVRLARMLLAEGDLANALHFLALKWPAVPLDAEGEILLAGVSARMNQAGLLEQALAASAKRGRLPFGRANATAGQAMMDVVGAPIAIEWVRRYGGDRIDSQNGERLEAARTLIGLHHALGQSEAAQKEIAAIEGQLGNSSGALALRGYWLELQGESEAAHTAYQSALEANPSQPDALAGLGRLSQAEAPADAIDFFNRAVAADPEMLPAASAVIRLLREQDQLVEAQTKLDIALIRWPYSGTLALEQVELAKSTEQPPERVTQLLGKARRFSAAATPAEVERIKTLIGQNAS